MLIAKQRLYIQAADYREIYCHIGQQKKNEANRLNSGQKATDPMKYQKFKQMNCTATAKTATEQPS